MAAKVLMYLREYLKDLEQYYAGKFGKEETQWAIRNLVSQIDKRISEEKQ